MKKALVYVNIQLLKLVLYHDTEVLMKAWCPFILDCNKEILNSIIEEILNREDLFESKKTEFEKKLRIFREKYDV